MWNLLNTWRQKDEQSRRMAALSISAGITTIIAIIWAITFFSHSSEKATVTRTQKASRPLTTLRENVTQAFQTMKAQFDALGTILPTTLSTSTIMTATGTESNVPIVTATSTLE